MTTKIAIAGAKGRMGENLIRSGLSNQNTQIVGVFDVIDIDETFLKKVGLPSTIKTSKEDSFIAADVIIDFTSPSALFSFTESAVANNTSLIVGTTGLEEKHFRLLEQACSNNLKCFSSSPVVPTIKEVLFATALSVKENKAEGDVKSIMTSAAIKESSLEVLIVLGSPTFLRKVSSISITSNTPTI